MYVTEFDVPAPLALATQEVHLDGVSLGNGLEVRGAASWALPQGMPKGMLGP